MGVVERLDLEPRVKYNDPPHLWLGENCPYRPNLAIQNVVTADIMVQLWREGELIKETFVDVIVSVPDLVMEHYYNGHSLSWDWTAPKVKLISFQNSFVVRVVWEWIFYCSCADDELYYLEGQNYIRDKMFDDC